MEQRPCTTDILLVAAEGEQSVGAVDVELQFYILDSVIF